MSLTRDEYVLDVTTEFDKQNKDYYLLFRRSAWLHPLHLENLMYIEILYQQAAVDYLEGHMYIIKPLQQLQNDKMVQNVSWIVICVIDGSIVAQS